MRGKRTKIVTGIHIIKKPTKHGPCWYIYAWRGGPRIDKRFGPKPVVDQNLLALVAKARTAHLPGDELAATLLAYRQSPEYTKLAPDTQADYRASMDIIESYFGDAPLAAFNDWRIRGEIIAQRDKMAANPRKADKYTTMFGTILNWAMQRGQISINVGAGIPKLHHANRADQVWEQSDMDAFEPQATPQLWRAIKLASLTGLRLGDLLKLSWDHIGQDAVVMVTNKRGKRVVIPMLPELRTLLASIEGDEGPILRNSYGNPWSADGLKTVFQRAKKKTGIAKRIHDLRGTYVTFLAVKGLTDQEIARIVGWSEKRISEIRARYVDEARVVIELSKRLSAK